MMKQQRHLNTYNDKLRSMFDAFCISFKPDIIADVGAYTGEESARFHRLSPDSHCHLFEANYDNIRECIYPRNDLQSVVVNHMAVADYDGEITFNVPVMKAEEDRWKRLVGSVGARSDGGEVTSVIVPCVKLDTYFAKEIEENKTFMLWVDVEGALDKVLAGAPRVLERTIAIMAEVERQAFWVGQGLAEDNIATLGAAGFMLLGDSYTPEVTPQSDIICLNKRWLELFKSETQ